MSLSLGAEAAATDPCVWHHTCFLFCSVIQHNIRTTSLLNGNVCRVAIEQPRPMNKLVLSNISGSGVCSVGFNVVSEAAANIYTALASYNIATGGLFRTVFN